MPRPTGRVLTLLELLQSGGTRTVGTDPTTVTAVATQTTTVGTVGYYIAATVTGLVYSDTNGNGAQGSGENGIANVPVTVTDSLGVPHLVTTDAGGRWTASVPPGNTLVDVDQSAPQIPAGSLLTQGPDPRVVTAVAGVSSDAGKTGYYLPATVNGQRVAVDES